MDSYLRFFFVIKCNNNRVLAGVSAQRQISEGHVAHNYTSSSLRQQVRGDHDRHQTDYTPSQDTYLVQR
jgi:hypothetical protein